MTRHVRRPPRVFVVAGWRYEPEWLVNEFRANCSWADEVVIVDDRGRDPGELWVHEGNYRLMQRAALEAAGIRAWDWVVVSAPDERWTSDAGRIIRSLTRLRHRTTYSFPLREMWTPTQWRADGMWARKRRSRLFPYLPGQTFADGRIQTQPIPTGDGYRRRKLDRPLIFHTENIDPGSRVERAIVYEAMELGSQGRAAESKWWKRYDPDRRYMRAYGYAYLADPRGVVLRPVPAGAFRPRVTRTYEFRVPDAALTAECGMSRSELMDWLTSTLGVPEEHILAGRHG